LIDRMGTLPATRREQKVWRQAVESQGRQPIGMADSLITGVCVAADAVLLTRNRKPSRMLAVSIDRASGCAGPAWAWPPSTSRTAP
jgi:predicted nucleic acid-binding protein